MRGDQIMKMSRKGTDEKEIYNREGKKKKNFIEF